MTNRSAVVMTTDGDPIQREYSLLAGRYDSRWSHYIEASTRQTLARMSIRDADRVLDVGCGTGVLLAEIHRRYPQARLAGVDAVAAMLEVARRRLPADVELREAWADRLPFDNASFNLVVCSSVFHFLPDPVAALREWARVLRDGGALVITDWSGDSAINRLRQQYLRLVGSAPVKVYRERDLLRLLEETGYNAPGIERYKISWSWGLMTATAARPARQSQKR